MRSLLSFFFFVLQEDLVKDPAHLNFIKHLQWPEMSTRQRVLAAFVLTAVMNNFRAGQEACLNQGLHRACHQLLMGDAGVCISGDGGWGGRDGGSMCFVACMLSIVEMGKTVTSERSGEI